jgi:hypothetical protein
MIRLLAAAAFLGLAAAPAIACDFQKSVSTDTQKRAVASQPSAHSTSPGRAAVDRKQS